MIMMLSRVKRKIKNVLWPRRGKRAYDFIVKDWLSRGCLDIKLAASADRDNWDGFLSKFQSCPPLNCYAWKDILQESYNVKPLFFMASDKNGKTHGLLPAYVSRNLRGRKELYSLRFGCVADDNKTFNELISHTKEFCEANGIGFDSVSSGYRRIETDARETVKKTVIMDIADTEESAWKSLRDKTRNMIRKAVSSNLTAERGFHNLKEFYNIYTTNMLYKGIPVHSYKFFKNISERLKGSAELIVAQAKRLATV